MLSKSDSATTPNYYILLFCYVDRCISNYTHKKFHLIQNREIGFLLNKFQDGDSIEIEPKFLNQQTFTKLQVKFSTQITDQP